MSSSDQLDPGQVTARAVIYRDVPTAHPDDDVMTLVRLVLRHGADHIPVVDDDLQLLGVVSRTELIAQLAEPMISEGVVCTAANIMFPVSCLDEHASISAVAATLACELFSEVVAVTRDGVLVGLATATEIVRWLFEHGMFEDRLRRTPRASSPPWRPLEG